MAQILHLEVAIPGRATVEFTWRWAPNVLGERFDAWGADVRSFSTDEQMQLMDEYGVRFYRQAPQRAVVALEKSPRGWRLAND